MPVKTTAVIPKPKPKTTVIPKPKPKKTVSIKSKAKVKPKIKNSSDRPWYYSDSDDSEAGYGNKLMRHILM